MTKTEKNQISRAKSSDVTTVRSDVAIPEQTNNRGTKPIYPFNDLKKGESFGIKGKTAASIASVVSGYNRQSLGDKIGEDGKPVFKTKKIKQSDGSVKEITTDKVEQERKKHFFAQDVDPKTDPDAATVRVFRDK